jgi:hypothetical protein
MQQRPLNTDDLAGRQSVEEPAGGTQQTGEPETTDSPDLTLVRGGEQPRPERQYESGKEGGESLLPYEQTGDFRQRWQGIQASFVDEPRQAVEQADALVADLLQKLAAGFSEERKRLEGQWDRGGDVSTEDLRVALTRYRSFFDRLLAA